MSQSPSKTTISCRHSVRYWLFTFLIPSSRSRIIRRLMTFLHEEDLIDLNRPLTLRILRKWCFVSGIAAAIRPQHTGCANLLSPISECISASSFSHAMTLNIKSWCFKLKKEIPMMIMPVDCHNQHIS